MTKYPAGIDYAAFALIWFIIKIKEEKKIGYYVKNILLSIAAFLLPTLVTIIFFAIQGNLKDFIEVFYMVTFKYPSKKTLGIILKTLFLFPKDLFVIFAFFILGFVYLSTKKELRFLFMIILIWGGSTLFCILSPGKDFTYYWFQFWGVASLVIPFAILALNNFFSKITDDKKSSLIFNLLIIIFVFDLSLGNNFQNFSPKEYVYEARDILKSHVKKDTLMLTDEEGTHILYWMLNLNPPAKYVHTMGDFSNYYKNEGDVFEPQILVNPSYKWYDKLRIRENYNLLFAKGKYKIYTRKTTFSN